MVRGIKKGLEAGAFKRGVEMHVEFKGIGNLEGTPENLMRWAARCAREIRAEDKD